MATFSRAQNRMMLWWFLGESMDLWVSVGLGLQKRSPIVISIYFLWSSKTIQNHLKSSKVIQMNLYKLRDSLKFPAQGGRPDPRSCQPLAWERRAAELPLLPAGASSGASEAWQQDGTPYDTISGWWFGCHFLFSHILGIIIPID